MINKLTNSWLVLHLGAWNWIKLPIWTDAKKANGILWTQKEVEVAGLVNLGWKWRNYPRQWIRILQVYNSIQIKKLMAQTQSKPLIGPLAIQDVPEDLNIHRFYSWKWLHDYHQFPEKMGALENGKSYYYYSKTYNWVEWTVASVSLSQTKGNNIDSNNRVQMQNDTESEIGRSLFTFIYNCNR